MSTDNAVSLNGTATTWPEVLTLEEAAAFVRLSESTLLQEALVGRLHGKQLEGAWRFSKQAILNWLDRPKSDIPRTPEPGAGAEFIDEDPEEIIEKVYRERKKNRVSRS